MTRQTYFALLALLVVMFTVPVFTSVPTPTALVITVAVGTQWWAGAWVWSRIRPTASEWEFLGVGLAVGTAASTFSGLLVAMVAGVPWGWALVPLVVGFVALVGLVRSGSRAGRAGAGDFSPAALMGLVAGLGSGIVAIAWAVRSYPLGTGDWARYHPDMGFFEALGNSLAYWGPAESIFTPDSLIRYHWLVYAWSGQIQGTSGSEPFSVLTRVLPVVALMGAVLVAVAWTRELSRSRWAPLLAVGLLVAGGFVGAGYGNVLNFDSPSTAFTTMSLMTVVWIAGRMAAAAPQTSTGRWPEACALVVLAAMVAGGKVSSAAVAVAVVALLWIVSLLRSSWDRRGALVALVAVTIGSVGAFVVVAAGSADPGGLRIGDLLDRSSSVQGLNPVPGAIGVVAGTLVLALAVVFRGAGVLWLLIDKDERNEPWAWVGLALLAASVAPILFISGGFNEVWFATAAAGPLSVLSAVGVVKAYSSADPRRRWRVIALVVLCVAFISALVLWAWSTGPSGGNVWTSTFRWAGPVLALVVSALLAAVLAFGIGGGERSARTWIAWTLILMVLASFSGRLLTFIGPLGSQPGMRSELFTPAQPFVQTIDSALPATDGRDLLTAAAWLRENSQVRDLVVTNMTTWPTVPAITGRQTLASGIRYQAPYGPSSMLGPLVEREGLSWDFIRDPSEAAAAALCDYPVLWLLIDRSVTDAVDWTPWAVIEFESNEIAVLRWDTARCP